MSTLNYALKLADKLPVFPCGPNKSPLTEHGFKDASQDLGQITNWWTQHAGALIGVPATKFCVIDCDLQHRDAQVWYDRADLPITRTHITRSGGRHLLFQPHPGVGITASKIAPHIDTRGCGKGFVLWWPAEGLDVLHADKLAEVPPWIVERLKQNPPEPPSRDVGAVKIGGNGAHCTVIAGRKLNGIIRKIASASR